MSVSSRSEIHEPTNQSPESHSIQTESPKYEDSLKVNGQPDLNDRTELVLNEFDREVARLQAKERLQKQLADREAERARRHRIDEDKDEMTRAPGRLTPG